MFGLQVTNDYNEILFSDSSYVLEYVGKAVWQQRYNFNSPSNINPRYWRFESYPYVFSRPHYIINRYRVSIPSTDILCFSHAPWPSFTAILYTTAVDANTTELLVVAQENDVPDVYCFRKIQPKSGGHGIALRDANGNLTFTSNAQILVPRAASIVTVPYTSQFNQGWSLNTSFRFAVNGPDQNTTYTNMNPFIRPIGAVTKPAMAYYPAITGVIQSGASLGGYDFIESAVRYNTAQNAIEQQWGFSAFTFINSTSAEIRVPQYTQFCMMIDGADYD